MSAKIAAVLSPIVIGAFSAAGLFSRFSLVVSGSGTSAAVADIATQLPSRLSVLVHFAASGVTPTVSLVLHGAFAPTNAALSFLSATQRFAFATIANAVHLALLYLPHWM